VCGTGLIVVVVRLGTEVLGVGDVFAVVVVTAELGAAAAVFLLA
jgi:hypothetical protein